MSWGPKRGIPVPSTKVTKTTKTVTPQETTINQTTTTSRSRPTTSGLRPPTTLYAAPVRQSTGAIPKYGAGGLGVSGRSSITSVDIGGKRTITSSKYGGGGLRPPGAIPKPKTLKSNTSTTSTTVGGQTVTKSTKKIVAVPVSPMQMPRGAQGGLLPAGYYNMPMLHGPRTAQGKQTQYSSPADLRSRMDNVPKQPLTRIMPEYRETQDYRRMLKDPGHRDVQAGCMFLPPRGQSPSPPQHQGRLGALDENVDPTELEDEYEDRNAEAQDMSHLEDETEMKLMQSVAKSPTTALKAASTRKTKATTPIIITEHGPVEAQSGVISTKTVIQSPGHPQIIGHHMATLKTISPGSALKEEISVMRTTPKKPKSPVTQREVLHVTSSIMISPGIVQKTKTVTYDAPPSTKGPEKPLPTPHQLSMLVDEENEDIEKTKGLLIPILKVSQPETYGVHKHVEDIQLDPDSVTLLEQSMAQPIPTPDEEQEEAQPEMIASMLNTEERGLALGEAPANIYNYLFADERVECVDVCSAAPVPLQDIVVPMSVPNQVQEIEQSSDVIQASIVVEKDITSPVKENIYVETVGKSSATPTNSARKGSMKHGETTINTTRISPHGIQDVEPVIDVVGAPPAGALNASMVDEEPQELDPTVTGIEFVLNMEPPRHSSRVQLRGSQNPQWFPGYMIALPDIPDIVSLAKSPSVVFNAAWRSTQPDIFDENSFLIA